MNLKYIGSCGQKSRFILTKILTWQDGNKLIVSPWADDLNRVQHNSQFYVFVERFSDEHQK